MMTSMYTNPQDGASLPGSTSVCHLLVSFFSLKAGTLSTPHFVSQFPLPRNPCRASPELVQGLSQQMAEDSYHFLRLHLPASRQSREGCVPVLEGEIGLKLYS